MVGSDSFGIYIYLFWVSCFILARVFYTELSLNGCIPNEIKYNRHPADQTSHLLEYGKFYNC